MKKLSPKALAALCLCLVFVLVSACSNKEANNATSAPASKDATTTASAAPAETSTSEPAKKEPVTLSFSTFNAWWTSGTIQKAVEMYEAKTGNKIDAQIFPDDQFANIITAKMASGDTPDLFAIWPSIGRFNTDQLIPLDGPWTSKIDMDRAKKYGYASLKDGKLYTAPYGALSYQGMMYNKEIFKQAGISLPLKNYEEVLAAAEAIKKLGVTPFTFTNKEGWTMQIAMYAGSNYIPVEDPQFATDLASNKAKPSEKPALVDMFNRVLALKDKGYVNKDHLSTTMAMGEQALAEGKTAMVFGGDWLYADFLKNYPDQVDNIGMTAINWGDDAAELGVTKGGSGNGLYIPKNSKHPVEAAEFINFVMSDEVMKAMYEISPGINELGIATKASDWDNEMQGYVDSGIAKLSYNFIDAIKFAFPGNDISLGDFSGASTGIMAGKDVIKGLDDWYSEYAKLNKAKQIAGF